MGKKPVIGVLALQGDFEKHGKIVESLGGVIAYVKTKEQLTAVDGLIIPGGESTTIGKLLVRFDMMELLQGRITEGFPVFGTCAGLILLANTINGSRQHKIGGLDVSVQRNAYGRQISSFETNFHIKPFENHAYHAIFIRAPKIIGIGDTVEVLASYEDLPVLVRQDNILAASFHPELTDDDRIHGYFVEIVTDYCSN